MFNTARAIIGSVLCLIGFLIAFPLCLFVKPAGFIKALDALFNVCWIGGLQGETTSSHAGRWLVSGLPVPQWVKEVSLFCNLWEDNHCINHILPDFIGKPLS